MNTFNNCFNCSVQSVDTADRDHTFMFSWQILVYQSWDDDYTTICNYSTGEHRTNADINQPSSYEETSKETTTAKFTTREEAVNHFNHLSLKAFSASQGILNGRVAQLEVL